MYKDLTGKRFGHQIAVSFEGYNTWRNALWLCMCDCGKVHIVPSGKLIQGKSTSCGCYRASYSAERLTKHGLTRGGKTRIFNIWVDMRARCYNPKHVNYRSYGGRGVCVCEEWSSYANFHRWAIENGYADGLTLDRIDNNGNYSPSNCQWITAQENRMKQRKTILLLGKSISENAREIGISRYMLTKYYRSHGLNETEYFINKFINQQSIEQ